jgi:hypothetical protein
VLVEQSTSTMTITHRFLQLLSISLFAACIVDDDGRVADRSAMLGSSGSDSGSGSETGMTPGDCPDGSTEQAVDCGFKLAKNSGGPWSNGAPDCNNPTYVQNGDGTWTATVSFEGRCNCVWTPMKGTTEVSPLACKDVDPKYTTKPGSKDCEEKGILIPDKPYKIERSATAATKDAAMFAAEKKCKEAAAADCTARCTKVEGTEKPTTKLACCVPNGEAGSEEGCGSESGDPEPLPDPIPIPDAP